ncbi:MAG: CDP-glycerol glycerophosphotransferase family protein [Propionibacteriaceae bacterium]|nr:CDP-glycerol glycerophosphotransferase family protein [Propionibacteriaceae bacterium]
MNIVFLPFRLLPRRDKVTFISRVSDAVTVDFSLLRDELERVRPTTRVVVLCKQLRPGLAERTKYLPHILVQMFHIATSRVVVLDSYCMAVSAIRPARTGLEVIQLWHALGAFKRFGYSILGCEESHTDFSSLDSPDLAKIMGMHRNYTAATATYQDGISHLAQAYNVDPSIFRVIPLPRVDLLASREAMSHLRTRILAKHPELVGGRHSKGEGIQEGKGVVLFAPTFRRGGATVPQNTELLKALVGAGYTVVSKMHRLSHAQSCPAGVIEVPEFAAMELLAVADVVVTDYSAITFEAYLTGTPVVLFTPDVEQYACSRGFYTRPEEFPGQPCRTVEALLTALTGPLPSGEEIDAFVDRYVASRSGNTEQLGQMIAGGLSQVTR